MFGNQGTTGKEPREAGSRKTGHSATPGNEWRPTNPSVLLSLSQESESQDRGFNSQSSVTCPAAGGTGIGRKIGCLQGLFAFCIRRQGQGVPVH